MFAGVEAAHFSFVGRPILQLTVCRVEYIDHNGRLLHFNGLRCLFFFLRHNREAGVAQLDLQEGTHRVRAITVPTDTGIRIQPMSGGCLSGVGSLV